MANLSKVNVDVLVRLVPGSTSVRVMMEAKEYLQVHMNQTALFGGNTDEIEYLIQSIGECIQNMPVETGADIIAVERAEQLFSKGFSPEHDKEWKDFELIKAAMCYAWESVFKDNRSMYWPWDKKWWKPSNDPIKNLAKAGALIAAEIDRLKAEKK